MGGGEALALRLGPGAGRIDHHRVDALEFVGLKRAAEQVARGGGELLQPLGLTCGAVEGGDHGGVGLVGRHLGLFGEWQTERAEAGEQIGDVARRAQSLAHGGKERRFALGRRLQEGAGRRRDQRGAHALHRLGTQRQRLVVPGQPGEAEAFGKPGEVEPQRRRRRACRR